MTKSVPPPDLNDPHIFGDELLPIPSPDQMDASQRVLISTYWALTKALENLYIVTGMPGNFALLFEGTIGKIRERMEVIDDKGRSAEGSDSEDRSDESRGISKAV